MCETHITFSVILYISLPVQLFLPCWEENIHMELQRIKDSNVKVTCCCKLGQLLKSMQNQSKWSPVWQLWKLSLLGQPKQMLQLGAAFSKAAKCWVLWIEGCPGWHLVPGLLYIPSPPLTFRRAVLFTLSDRTGRAHGAKPGVILKEDI